MPSICGSWSPSACGSPNARSAAPIDVWGAEGLPEAVEAIPRDKIARRSNDARHPVLATEDRHGRVVRPLVLASRQERACSTASDAVYHAAPPVVVTSDPAEPPAEPIPAVPVVWEMESLFGETPKQLTLAQAAPSKPRPKPALVNHGPVSLTSLDDWLDFAEALLGRQDIAPDSLAGNFTSLSEMEDYEDKLESAFYMHMDPVHRLGERFPWLDTVEQIAVDQGFFHWELRFASVFVDGGFDLQVGNPPWVRPEWDEMAS